jgi:4-hydroxy-3-methylbut-2-enyl diphosphate reductase
MTVIRAAVMGRCMGVRRAESLALEAAARRSAALPVLTLGPLIHNPQAVAELEARGIVAVSEARLEAEARGRTVVIRAHGVPPAMRARLEELGAEVVDATCPRVLASQRKAHDLAERGFTVIIAGDKDHGEVAGIAGCAPGSLVVASAEEAARVETPGPAALIAQTTMSSEEYLAIRAELERRIPDLLVVDSICPATEERRRSLSELAAKVEAIVVVGGRNSANTSRLHAAALAMGKPAWHVETAADLADEVFSFERVGLTAGASTPESLVDEVERALEGQG